ncbi:DEHA2C03652p [Debaryomyces hansenii CBS767]|uniref:Selenoprotein O n=1 Tax=Debaryomyces hansenii (strain ATCC 36239 / CBS 767 / BCRC 21394 / JCM 1990 / NBRC 0083 / IGC 2968) TaxID=284592 RepID=Q6BVC9_DEBHA|nr:DEHA2C03652p [Debaryomyces hansenii CBS767]CAG85885.2 DEHA2C03652p [Debaryomyces hansenii CBS767]|eukprot:XP_457840.2 DEHA2C03652p [Debaryomyces hansenii CBS767]
MFKYKCNLPLEHSSIMTKRSMHTKKLAELPKTTSFTKYISPDGRIPKPEDAMANKDNIIHVPRVLQKGGFSWSLPEKRAKYRYLTSSDKALNDLGIDSKEVENPEYQKLVTGEFYLNKEDFQKKGYPFPYSQAYAGWQFGQFAGQLGDGRVVNLFEVPKNVPDKNNRHKYELQLKGAGMTPYSRFADGKAVIRSSIREYIISEHLNAVGIPTTRALSLSYLPETFAQRHRAEKCAIVSRFAESWVRLGTFDLYRWRSDRDGIKELSDYVINELFTIDGEKFGFLNKVLSERNDFFDSSKETIGELTDYDKMYLETIVRNASTTAIWQSYGFLNGVLNTDNTSVLGLSIDFGPFSIMDKYDPNFTPNSEDHELRYSYRNTPTAIWWNLTRMGENLAELIGAGSEILNDQFFKENGIKKEWEDRIITRATKLIEAGGELYQYAFTKKYVETIFNRLGLESSLINAKDPEVNHKELIDPMLDMLYKVQCDFNKFFLILQSSNLESGYDPKQIAETILLPGHNALESKYSTQELIDEICNWLKIYDGYLSKSGNAKRKSISKYYNPLFLPRNWILNQVIEFTEEHNAEDLSYLKKLEKMCFNPYDKSKWGNELKELEQEWLLQSDIGADYSMLQCSCSS